MKKKPLDDTLNSIMQELELRLKYTFGQQLDYLGTTSDRAKESSDIDVIVVLNQISDAHIRHVWNILNQIRNNWNVMLDCRIRTPKDIDTHPLLEGYLLAHFLHDYYGKNPFSKYKASSNELRDECRKRIERQEHRILAMVPRIAADSNRITEVGQAVYDAVRAFLILEGTPCTSKEKARDMLCDVSAAFNEAKKIYSGSMQPSTIVDVPGFIADALAIVKHLSYRTQSYQLSEEVLLVNTPSSVMPHPLDDRLGFDANMPLGLVCLSSYLCERDIKVSILDAYAKNLSASGVVDEIMKKESIPRIIAFNAASPNIDVVHQITKYLKRINKDIIIVCGGPHATLSTKDTLSEGFIDYAVVGEGELPFEALVKVCLANNREKAKTIEGIYLVNSSGKLCGVPNKTLFSLENLPIPRFEHLPLEECYFTKKRRLYLHTTRGCNFWCIYCSVRKFWGGEIRRVPLNLLFQHLEELIAKHNPKEIQIVDDNFSHEQGKVIEEFCRELIKRKISIAWKCQVRADQLNSGTIILMKETGCFEVDIGVESGNKDIQKRIKKFLNLEKTLEVVKLLKKSGITAKAFFILGFPKENYTQIADSINFAIDLKGIGLTDVAFFPAMPFPGTELAEEVGGCIGKPVLRGAIMDKNPTRYQSFASHRLKKYSAMPEVPVNELFNPKDLRLLVHFAYDRFEENRKIEDLKKEFKEFKIYEEVLLYGN